MFENRRKNQNARPPAPSLTDQDIYEAMQGIEGYLDITPEDFKEIYQLAYAHALERLRRSVLARDIMTRKVIQVTTETPLWEVAATMGRHGVSGVPVVDGENAVVGVISEKDFLQRLAPSEPKNFMAVVAECLQVKKCLAMPLRAQKAADLMSSPPITISEETTLTEVARLFTERRINRAPVTNRQGHLMGMITRGDIIRASSVGADHD